MRVVSTAYNDRPGRSVAAVRPGARRLRARRGRVDAGARARRSRARARRDASTRRSTATARPATPIIGCRWRRTAGRSSARCTLAIERSGRRREEIGYVNYHGTSTVLNDAVESRCVRQVFGAPRRSPGRLVGQVDDRPSAGRERRRRRRHRGAGADPAASCRRRSTFIDADPACDLDFIPNQRPRLAESKPRSATASASDRRTARSSSAAP